MQREGVEVRGEVAEEAFRHVNGAAALDVVPARRDGPRPHKLQLVRDQKWRDDVDGPNVLERAPDCCAIETGKGLADRPGVLGEVVPREHERGGEGLCQSNFSPSRCGVIPELWDFAVGRGSLEALGVCCALNVVLEAGRPGRRGRYVGVQEGMAAWCVVLVKVFEQAYELDAVEVVDAETLTIEAQK